MNSLLEHEQEAIEKIVEFGREIRFWLGGHFELLNLIGERQHRMVAVVVDGSNDATPR